MSLNRWAITSDAAACPKRISAATNALDYEADIAKVQQWLGHVNIVTTRSYDRRKMKPEDSPAFKVSY